MIAAPSDRRGVPAGGSAAGPRAVGDLLEPAGRSDWRAYAIRSGVPDRRLLAVLDRQRTGADRPRLGVAGLLLPDSRDLNSFVTDRLGPAPDDEERRGTDLVPTLDAYFRTKRSLNETAQDLRVHPNTVTRRFSRIDNLLGPDGRGATRSLDVQLALLIHSVVKSLGPG